MLKTVSSITNAIGALNFKGTWNAATNTPTIVSGVGVKGDYFVVSVAGSTTIDGISNWGVGDWITYNGTVWQRVEGGADLNGVNLSVSGTTTLSNLTASTALALNASKEVVSVTNTGTGDNVLGTSPTMTTPRVVTSLNDTNGNEVFGITATGSAVNELTVANSATGNNPTISATGSDTNIGITLTPKGTGGVVFPAGAVGTPAITTSSDTNTGIFFPTADTAAITTDGTERARITSGGYFKASNTGSYVNSTSTHHEFVQSANDRDLWVRGTDASLTSIVLQTDSTRSQSSAFDLLVCTTGNNADAEFVARGDGNCFADGTFQNNGADYAEFFESINGQALTLGASVVLEGNKVREATDQDPASAVLGVVRPKEPSKASMVIGNTAWNKWANKYLSDDFDRYFMEDHDVVEWEETITDEEGNTSTKQHSYESQAIPAGITVPSDATRKTHDEKGNKFQHYKLNPAWNPDAEYVNRENRPEWNIIGLLGQVKILKGQPVGDRWIKMRDVSETSEEWMIR